MTPETMIGRSSICGEKPVICQSEQAVSSEAGDDQERARRPCRTSRPTTIIEIIVPTPRGASTRPVGDHRIAHQVLQHRRQQRQAGEQDDADDEDEDQRR